jgi:hypothetical protein
MPWSKCDADARADHHLMAHEREWFLHDLDDARGDSPRLLGRCDGTLYDGEFIAADPAKRVRLADAACDARRHRLQQRVADGMSQRVVHFLEAIEIEAMHGERLAMPDALKRLLEALMQQRAVRKAGERVVVCHVGDLGFGLTLLGDVLMCRYPAAAGHGPPGNGNEAAVAELLDAV